MRKKRISPAKIIAIGFLSVIAAGTVLLLLPVSHTGRTPVSFVDALYESVSALATVGLTAGVTTTLGVPAQLMIILFMFFGRVGVLTISLGFLMGDKAEDRFRYADTNLLIG